MPNGDPPKPTRPVPQPPSQDDPPKPTRPVPQPPSQDDPPKPTRPVPQPLPPWPAPDTQPPPPAPGTGRRRPRPPPPATPPPADAIQAALNQPAVAGPVTVCPQSLPILPPPAPVPRPGPYAHYVNEQGDHAAVWGPSDNLYLELQFSKGVPEDRSPGHPGDEAIARDLALAAVRQARSLLPNGPYNNRAGLPEKIRNRAEHPLTEDGRGDFIWQDGMDLLEEKPGDPNRLFDQTRMAKLPDGLVRALSLMAASTIKMEGGVCEKFSSVVLGILSTTAPPGTEALKVAWSGDHHYVVVRYGTSQWYVADPWPHNAYVQPWADNYFERASTENYTRLTVHAPVEDMYGVVFDHNELENSKKAASREVPYTRTDGQFDHNWGQRDNLPRGVAVPPRGILAAGEEDWG
ncbi:MAG: hypothetical protein U1F70_05675 [Candidatus Competibacteraceae bacterium]